MNRSRSSLDRLIARAREAKSASTDDIAVPMGFSARVVARAEIGREEAPWWQVIELRGWRVLSGAVCVALLSVALNLQPIADAIEQDVLAADDPVTFILGDS
ncbi:hypothetical protein [Synoicihabitans lomoniglobus]|uniref:Uncharacterized protein n=1 Tax=Synoicihabitans lomoniglobus TaxID=2909285 RepID=A0AAF0I668_9BACT|nr:hypothetical protein [Opitutaceae bacterium LMO-M01]WED65926.1 hypothetical protein PXH66_03565 [Opitutaceae bacterium LMO-M01]